MASRDSTRTKLLDAAEDLLFTRGVGATPVDAILGRAGVSPATLYRAYPSKEALLAAALVRRHDAWLAVWDEALAPAPDDRARLLAVFDALAAFRSRPEAARWCAFLGTSAELVDPPPELAAALDRETDTLRERLTALAVPLVGEGAPALAESLLLLVSGQLAMRLRDGDAADATLARRIAATLVDAARAPVD